MELQKMYTDTFVAQLKKDVSVEKYQEAEPFDIENPDCTQLSTIYNRANEIAPLDEGDLN